MTRRRAAQILLCVLTLASAVFIFVNSAGDSEESSRQSLGVTQKVAQAVYPGYREMTVPEQQTVLKKIHGAVREGAHFTEFMLLGFLAYLTYGSFLQTPLPRDKKRRFGYVAVLFACALYALSDEIHQIFVPGRAFELFDIGMDSAGAAVGGGIALLVYLIADNIRHRVSHRKNLSA